MTMSKDRPYPHDRTELIRQRLRNFPTDQKQPKVIEDLEWCLGHIAQLEENGEQSLRETVLKKEVEELRSQVQMLKVLKRVQ